jgi:hypothetical protein
MQLTSQSPNIQDVPAFLRAMAEALEQMHAEQRAHGAIIEGALKNWLTDKEDAFDGERFKAAAKPADQLPDDPLRADVHSFATYCIGFIAGTSAAEGQAFMAAHYQGSEWPYVFLQLLETLTKQASSSCVSISDLRRALMEPAAPETIHEPDPIDYTVDHSVPSLAKSDSAAPAVRISLRNATVGKPYSYEPGVIACAIAEKLGHDPTSARISHLQLPEDCGLEFDQTTGAISGIPTRAFDKELSLDYVPSLSARSLSAKVTLLINPDPASLWKDLPPPSDAPYQKALLDHSDVQLGPFRIVAASRRGRSHANKGEFRDDDYAIGYAADSGWLVVVVADGAGSATYSRRGSQIACAVAKNRLVAVLNSTELNQAEAQYAQLRDWQHPAVKLALRQSLYEAALDGHHKLRAEVAQPSEPLPAPATLRNYDTTLILLVMKKTGEGCIAATFAIGDGGAGILPHPSEGSPLTHADSGEHAGQTIFLTFDSTVTADEANLEKRFHLAETQEFAGALAMTDGITDPKFPSDASFADPAQWATLWGELQPVLTSSSALLDWMNFFSPGNHDDRTLVAVLPAQSAAPATP